MLLNEIFDSANEVTWSAGIGKFNIDDDEYSINYEEYDISLDSGIKSVIDFGFQKGDSGELTHDNKPARVLGSVLNGLKQKLKELNPDIVMFGALDKNGSVEERKVLYRKLASLFTKTTSYNHTSGWYKFQGGEYMFVSRFTPNETDEAIIQRLAAYEKP